MLITHAVYSFISNITQTLIPAVSRVLKRTHPAALLNQAMFEYAFADSGHWDYTILVAMSNIMALYIVQTTSPVSEFSIIEKTSQKLAMLISVSGQTLFGWNFQSLDPIASAVQTALVFVAVYTLLLTLSVLF